MVDPSGCGVGCGANLAMNKTQLWRSHVSYHPDQVWGKKKGLKAG